MKYMLLIILFVATTAVTHGQIISGKSSTKRVTIVKPRQESMTKIPDLIITGEKFMDENKDNFINANEECYISLVVENIGNGVAKNVLVQVSLGNNVVGLYSEKTINLFDINPNGSKDVKIPLKGEMFLENGVQHRRIPACFLQDFLSYYDNQI